MPRESFGDRNYSGTLGKFQSLSEKPGCSIKYRDAKGAPQSPGRPLWKHTRMDKGVADLQDLARQRCAMEQDKRRLEKPHSISSASGFEHCGGCFGGTHQSLQHSLRSASEPSLALRHFSRTAPLDANRTARWAGGGGDALAAPRAGHIPGYTGWQTEHAATIGKSLHNASVALERCRLGQERYPMPLPFEVA